MIFFRLLFANVAILKGYWRILGWLALNRLDNQQGCVDYHVWGLCHLGSSSQTFLHMYNSIKQPYSFSKKCWKSLLLPVNCLPMQSLAGWNTQQIKHCLTLVIDFYWGSFKAREQLNNRHKSDLIHYQTRNGLRHASGPVLFQFHALHKLSL